ncbi:MAG: DUF1800 family protein, partial [Chloroflexi bacterium CFX2]|nr:DUF1800 family protein [Chloroflexi bacterium CFX2]
EHLSQMGQLAFNLPTPDGYPDTSNAWQGSLMPRWQFAFELIRNETPKTKHNLNALLDVASTGSLHTDVDSLTSLLLGTPLDRLTRDGMMDTVHSAGATEEETLQSSPQVSSRPLPFSGDNNVRNLTHTSSNPNQNLDAAPILRAEEHCPARRYSRRRLSARRRGCAQYGRATWRRGLLSIAPNLGHC